MGKIVYIMGKSSSGKDTIFQKLKEALPEDYRALYHPSDPGRGARWRGIPFCKGRNAESI